MVLKQNSKGMVIVPVTQRLILCLVGGWQLSTLVCFGEEHRAAQPDQQQPGSSPLASQQGSYWNMEDLPLQLPHF